MRALSPTAQTVGAMLMTAAQHVAAGFDEQAKQEANNKLNLLYADVLTPQASRSWPAARRSAQKTSRPTNYAA